MPGRRVEERVKSNEATKGTRGSQQPSKGRAQGRGHGRHTASTTPHRDTREGSTRGTRGERHRAPRHARHRHHTHRTNPKSPGSPPRGRAAGEGEASDPRRPSQRRTATPPGTPYRHPHGAQRRPARARAVGPVLGPHARTDRTRDTRVGEPCPPAPEDGASGGGTAPDTRRPSQRWQANPPPGGRPPTTPAARSPHRACRPKGQCWAPTPTHPHPQQVGGGPQQPAQWAGSRGRENA